MDKDVILKIQKDILGIILKEPEAIYQVESLKPFHFPNAEYRKIYETMCSLMIDNITIDPIAVYERGKIDLVLLNELLGYGSSTAVLDKRCAYLIENYMHNQLRAFGNQLAKSNETDPFKLAQDVENKIFEITQQSYRKSFANIKEIHKDTLELLEEIKTKGENHFLVKTGYCDVDELIGGFKKTDLIIIAGRPGMGKTGYMLNVANRCGVKVGIFSLEMGKTQLSARLMAMETGIGVDRLLSGRFDKQEFTELKNIIPNPNLFIDDKSSIDIFELISKAKKLKIEENIGMIMVDYLQLVKDKTKDFREQEIASISGHLKSLAKDLEIPVVALAQLNRAVESRPDKKPQLSDLRESGAIEQDADMVLFVHRPEMFGINALEDGTTTKGLAQLLICKNRNGAVGEINLTFINNKTKFENYTPENF